MEEGFEHTVGDCGRLITRIGNFLFDILILGICICRASQSYIQNDTEMVLLKYNYNHIYYDITQCIFYKDYPVSFSKETGCKTNSVSAEYRKIYFQIYIYQISVVMFEYLCLPVWPSG